MRVYVSFLLLFHPSIFSHACALELFSAQLSFIEMNDGTSRADVGSFWLGTHPAQRGMKIFAFFTALHAKKCLRSAFSCWSWKLGSGHHVLMARLTPSIWGTTNQNVLKTVFQVSPINQIQKTGCFHHARTRRPWANRRHPERWPIWHVAPKINALVGVLNIEVHPPLEESLCSFQWQVNLRNSA